MKEIVKKAEEFALSEIKKYELPSQINFETSNKKAKELAEKLGADLDIVEIGARLMDIKLGEAFSRGKIEEHVKMSSQATKEFLLQFNLTGEVKNEIVKCVEGHHNKSWDSLEAEICANADCYRFLLTKNWLAFLNSLGVEDSTFEEDLKFAEEKLEEKWEILSLDMCKKELEEHYRLIKEIISKSR